MMSGTNFSQVTSRNDTARDIVVGFAAVAPNSAGVWRFVDRALADVPAVLAELGRVRAELDQVRAELGSVRLDRANLLAAIRATLAASGEGDADPLGYLRDELAEEPATPATATRWRG